MDVNPVLWLASRERWQIVSCWLITILMAGGVISIYLLDTQNVAWMFWSYIGGALLLLLYLGIASHSGRFLLEAHRSGLLELLLATPLSGVRIVQGQWKALLRRFGPPLTIFLIAHWFGTFYQQTTWSRLAATAATRTTTATASTNASGAVVITNSTVTTVTRARPLRKLTGVLSPLDRIAAIIGAFAGTVTIVGNLGALAWFGMWMGLNSRSSNMATLKTIEFVEVIPWFVASFAAMIIVPLMLIPSLFRGAGSQMMMWYPLITGLMSATLYLGKNAAFILWSRKKLYTQFRERAVRAISPVLTHVPPPLAPSAFV